MLSDGYEVVDFETVKQDKKHLILRHDVDFDLDAAARLADFEGEQGFRAIYFVLLTSEFYNLHAKFARTALSSILAQGHQLGLHFDTSIHHGAEVALSEAAASECQVLEQLTGQQIKVISMHRPPSDLVGRDVKFAGRLNAYAPHFTQGMGYCSDSRGAWHHGSPLESEAFRAGKALHLLTHPIWWTRNEPMTPQQSVSEFLHQRQDFLDQEAERNCTAYRRHKSAP